MGARERYRSCPAVSQISNFTVESSNETVCVKNAALSQVYGSTSPTLVRSVISQKVQHKHVLNGKLSNAKNTSYLPPMVGSWNSKNSSRTNRTTRHDFPTAVSPSRTSLKWKTLPLIVFCVLRLCVIDDFASPGLRYI